MINCPVCEHQNPDNATHCEACLTPLSLAPVISANCPQCGTPTPPEGTFCSQCGFPLKTEENKNIPQETKEINQKITPLPIQTVSLFHEQTSTKLEINPDLLIIHIGKPNEHIPPDIDVSAFPNSEIVSRSHADLKIEGESYLIEDVGSANGTYINNLPLSKGDRHLLRSGDRIALGKDNKMTFIFQMS